MRDILLFYPQPYTCHYYLNLLEYTNLVFLTRPNDQDTLIWGKKCSEMGQVYGMSITPQQRCYTKRKEKENNVPRKPVSIHLANEMG